MPVDIVLANEVRVRREGEWLCRGVPFPQGTLRDTAPLRLRDEAGREVPLDTEALARWPDGSVRWALLQFPVTFEGHGRKTYALGWEGAPGRREEGPRIALTKSATDWEVDNGWMRFRLPMRGRAFITELRRGEEAYVREVRAEVVDDRGTVFVSELAGGPEVEHLTGKMLGMMDCDDSVA